MKEIYQTPTLEVIELVLEGATLQTSTETQNMDILKGVSVGDF